MPLPCSNIEGRKKQSGENWKAMDLKFEFLSKEIITLSKSEKKWLLLKTWFYYQTWSTANVIC